MIRYLVWVVCWSTCCYLCHSEPCLIRDKDKIYDFTNKVLHWGNEQGTLVLSFCPQGHTGACNGSLLCAELHETHKETDEITQMTKAPTWRGTESRLVIEDIIFNKTAAARIELVCGKEKNAYKYSPRSDGGFLITAKQELVAACPIMPLDSCAIQAETERFDLKSLIALGDFGVEEGSIKICGNSTFNECPSRSVCNNNTLSTVPRMRLLNDTLSLEYLSEGKDKIAEITLNCSPFDTAPKIALLSNDRFFQYSMNTSYVCPTYNISCLIQLENHFTVDLSSLKNAHFPYGNTNVQLNPCGTLEPYGHCGGTSRSLCITRQDKSANETIEEGYILRTTTLNRTLSGDIIAQYEGQNSTFEMTLICSKEQELTIDESDRGRLKGKLRTPAVCPRRVASGEGCTLHLGENEEYDFTTLKNFTHNLTLGNTTLMFQLCTTSDQFCHKTDDTPICFTNLTRPLYSDGEIMFSALYPKNDEAHMNKSYFSLAVHMVCDYTAEKPVIISNERGHGNHDIHVSLIAKEACGKSLWKRDCHTELQDNLSNLSRNRTNYRAEIGNGSLMVLINVCQPLVPEEGMICDRGSRVCLVNFTEPLVSKRAVSYGRSEKITLVNGSYLLSYSSGDSCPELKRFRRTEIFLKCNRTSEVSSLRFVSDEKCILTFHWDTASVCSEKDGLSTTASTPTSSIATNSWASCELEFEGIRLDLKDFSYKSKTACWNFCRSGEIVCEVPGADLKLVGSPEYRNGVVVLKFREEGEGNVRENLIEFSCSNATQPLSVISGTKIVTKWPTPRVCSNSSSPCSSLDESLVSNIKGLHEGVYDGKTYVISLCEPVPPLSGTYCSGEAAACKVGTDSKAEAIAYLSSLTISNHNQTFSYVGSQCSSRKGANITTKVVLKCDKSLEEGKLKLDEMDECSYNFSLGTSLVCEESGLDLNDSLSEENERIPLTAPGGNSTAAIFGAVLAVICIIIIALGIAYLPLRRRGLRFLIRQRLHSVRMSDMIPLTEENL